MSEASFDFAKAANTLIDSMLTSQRRMIHGFESMTNTLDTTVGATDKEEVYRSDRVRLMHFKPAKTRLLKTPVLVVYALVNRPYMMDLQEDRSVIKKLLEYGLDIYLIDWGYPRKMDRFLTLEDYIEGYIDEMVDELRRRHGVDAINLVGVCQGGTFSAIYTSLHQEKVKNLVTMVAPFDFDTRDGLLNVWSKAIDPEKMSATLGNINGDFMNLGFLMLNPARLMVDKYMSFFEHMDNPKFVENFIRMERWIFDSPDQAGRAWVQFMQDTYHGNKLVEGGMLIGDHEVNLKNITCPVLNVFASRDHLVPPASSRVLPELVGSEEIESIEFPTGHIGMFTSRKSQTEYAPTIGEWLAEHSKLKSSKSRKTRPAKKK